jgi:hypothetical protein
MPSWYNNNWLLRQPATVTNNNSSAALVSFQTGVRLSGTAFTEFNNYANANGSDLRVTDSDGVALLPFALEQIDVVNQVVDVVVKVPYIAASGTDTIYLYYGNSAATSISNYATTVGPTTAQTAAVDIANQSNTVGTWNGSNVVRLRYQDQAHGGGSNLNGNILCIPCYTSSVFLAGGTLYQSTSTTKGASWSSLATLATPVSGSTFVIRSLGEMSDGTLLAIVSYDTNAHTASGLANHYCYKSVNGGATWSNGGGAASAQFSTSPSSAMSVPWTDGTDDGTFYGPIITTSGGDLYVHAYAVVASSSTCYLWVLKCPSGSDPSVGTNWVTQGTFFSTNAGLIGEMAMLELSSIGGTAGHWIAVYRDNTATNSGDLMYGTFTSTGASFSVTQSPVRMNLPGTGVAPNNAVAPALLALPNGVAALVWGKRYPNGSSPSPQGIYCAASLDGGATFNRQAFAMPYSTGIAGTGGSLLGLPAWDVSADGTIVLTYYYAAGASDSNIGSTTFTTDWILNSPNFVDNCNSTSTFTLVGAQCTADTAHVFPGSSGTHAIKFDNSAGVQPYATRVNWLSDQNPGGAAWNAWLYSTQIGTSGLAFEGQDSTPHNRTLVNIFASPYHVQWYNGSAYTDTGTAFTLNAWQKLTVASQWAASSIAGSIALNSAVATSSLAQAASGSNPLQTYMLACSTASQHADTFWLGTYYTQQNTPSLPTFSLGTLQLETGGFLTVPSSIPANYGSHITLSLSLGSGWSGGTTFTVSGVSGVSKVSQNVTSSSTATLVVAVPGLGSASNTGTLTISDGSVTSMVTVAVPTISVSPSAVSSPFPVVAVSGFATLWTVSSSFSVSGGSFSAIVGSPTIVANTAAGLTIQTGNEPAVLTITDNTTGATASLTLNTYAPPAIQTTAYVDKSGQLVYFLFGTNASPSVPKAVVQVLAAPKIYINGSLASCIGPYWDSVNWGGNTGFFQGNTPFLIYQLPNVVASTDVVTWTAPVSWVAVTGGFADGSPTLYTSGMATNFKGEFETPCFGYLPFNHLPTSRGGLQVGMNNSTFPLPQYFGSLCQNWVKNQATSGGSSSGGINGVGSYDANHNPLTISAGNGQAYSYISAAAFANEVDSTSYPNLTGTWTYRNDDTNVASPMKVWITVDPASATVTSGPTTLGTGSPNVSSGTVVNGVLTGQTWQWTIAFKGNATNYGVSIALFRSTASGAAGNWTAINEWMVAPNGQNGPAQTFDRSNLMAADQNFLTQAQGAAAFRWMTANLGYTPNGNQVQASELNNASDGFWAENLSPGTYTVSQIRPYVITPGTSKVYFANNYTGTTANGGVSPPSHLAYYWAPPDLHFAAAGSNTCFVMELVFTTNHNFSSGQWYSVSGTPITLSVQNGNSATVNFNWPDLQGANFVPVFVTGSNSLAFVRGAIPGITQQASTGCNTLTTSYTPSGITLTIGWAGAVTPYESCAAASQQIGSASIPWINIPLPATDSLVTAAAAKVFENTATNQPVIVEYMNEFWNSYVSFNWFPLLNYVAGFANPNFMGYAYAYRAWQIHNIFANYWAANGRAPALIKRAFGGQMFNTVWTQGIVSFINTYNAANPLAPIQMDALLIANYAVPNYIGWQVPTVHMTVSPSGGGSSSGNLAAGTYYAAYSWVDALSGLETTVGSSESAQFTVVSGHIPQVTLTAPAAPLLISSYNVYLTAANGASGTEVLYANVAWTAGSTSQTYNLSAANTGSATPPTNSRVPNYAWASASLAASDSRSIANTSVNPSNPYASNPWTPLAYMGWLRHAVKYNLTLYTQVKAHGTYLNTYVPVNGQSPPVYYAYEGCYQSYSFGAEQNGNVSPPNLAEDLQHDYFYHPEQYWVELAYLQSAQDQGLSLAMSFVLDGYRNWFGGANGIIDWSYAHSCYQVAGHGDNSDGKGTNLFCVIGGSPTGKAEDRVNVSPKLRAWQDWALLGNQNQATRRRRWFPGLNRMYRPVAR